MTGRGTMKPDPPDREPKLAPQWQYRQFIRFAGNHGRIRIHDLRMPPYLRRPLNSLPANRRDPTGRNDCGFSSFHYSLQYVNARFT